MSSVALLCSLSVRGTTSALVFICTCRATIAQSGSLALETLSEDFQSGLSQMTDKDLGWCLHAESIEPCHLCSGADLNWAT